MILAFTDFGSFFVCRIGETVLREGDTVHSGMDRDGQGIGMDSSTTATCFPSHEQHFSQRSASPFSPPSSLHSPTCS